MSVATHDRALATVGAAVDSLRTTIPQYAGLPHAPDALLVGRGGPLDSLGVVNLLVALEQEVEREFGCSIALLDVVVATPDREWTAAALAVLVAEQIAEGAA